MRSRKRSMLTQLIHSVTALMLTLGLVGCTGGINNHLPTEIPDLSTEDGEVVITFSYDSSLRAVIKPLVEAFNEENPSITVQYVPLSTEDYNTPKTVEDRLLMLAESADTTLTNIRTAEMGGYFLDLQPLIDADSTFDQADFQPETLSAMEDTQGRVLGLPMTLFLRGIFYDKAAFDKANLAHPKPGWTWDDFRRMTATLTQNQAGKARFGYADRSSASILQPLIDSALVSNDGTIDAETLASELDWYVQMAREEQLLGLKSTDDYWNALFNYAGAPAMWYGSLFEFSMGFVTGEPEAPDLMTLFADSAYGFAPFPVDANGENVNTTPVSALCGVISAGSEHPAEAWQWLKFLSEHWLVSDTGYANNQLHIPARRSVVDAVGFWNNYPSEVQEAMQYGLEHAWFSSLYSRAENTVLNAIEDTTEGRATDLLSALEEAETEQASWPQEVTRPAAIVVATPQPSESTALDLITINFFHNSYDRSGKAAITALVNQFNKDHKDEILVQASNVQQESGGHFIQMTNNYDCFLSQLTPQVAASSGLILDLTALMEAEDAVFQQDFDPLLLDAAQYNEGLYALPISSQPAIMAYNADLLAELGLEPPSLDWTFDEFLEMIIAVTSTSQDEPIAGFLQTSHLVSSTEMFFAGRGVQWRDMSDDFPVVSVDTPEMASAIALIAELEQTGVMFQAASGLDWYSSITDAMNSGQLGFWTSDAGEQKFDISGVYPLTINVGIAPLPYTDKPNGSYAVNDMYGLYISNKTDNPEACWELAKYLSEGVDALKGVPARTSVANSPEWEAFVGEENATVYRAAFSRNLSSAEIDRYDGVFWSPIISWIGQATMNIRDGNDPAQELAMAQQYADAYLACMAPYDVLSLGQDELWEITNSCAVEVDPSRQ